jgi:hypothetical protein
MQTGKLPGDWYLDSSCGTAALELRRLDGTMGSHCASQGSATYEAAESLEASLTRDRHSRVGGQ